MKKQSSKSKKPQRVADPQKRDFSLAVRSLQSTMGLGRTYLRRICAINTVTTNASGVVVLQNLASSASISSFSDFSSLAALYTAYRAKAVRVTLLPYFPVNTTAVVVPATVIAAPWRGGLSPSSLTQHLESVNCTIMSGYKSYVLTNFYEGDEDAHLWTQTTAAIAATDSFGISCVGQSVGATASTNVWNLMVEWLVEFRMAG